VACAFSVAFFRLLYSPNLLLQPAGVVLRNDRGEAIAGFACPLDHVLDAALALLKGLKFLEHIGVSKGPILDPILWI
jgi:hypothetical protein